MVKRREMGIELLKPQKRLSLDPIVMVLSYQAVLGHQYHGEMLL